MRDQSLLVIIILILAAAFVLWMSDARGEQCRNARSGEQRRAQNNHLFEPLRSSPNLTRSVATFIDRFERSGRCRRALLGALQTKAPDRAVLEQLRGAFEVARKESAGTHVPHTDPERARWRARQRLRDVPQWAHIRARVAEGPPEAPAYLDVGCADGSISAAFAEMLGLGADRAFACDLVLRNSQSNSSVTFAVSAPETLPFADAQFSLATLNMVAHHFAEPKKMFAEIKRVLRPNGLLLIREHDMPVSSVADTSVDTSVADTSVADTSVDTVSTRLDVEHALYACVFQSEQTCAEFATNYNAYFNRVAGSARYAHYRPMTEWIRELAPDFRLVARTSPDARDSNFAVYALFESIR